MHARIIHNHKLLDATRARLPALTGASVYGRGVFTVCAVRGGHAFLWPEHWARLATHAARAGLSYEGYTEPSVGHELARLIVANEVETGLARVALAGRAVDGMWGAAEQSKPEAEADLLITTTDAPHVPDEGLALTLSPFRVNTHAPLAGVKSLSYLEHVLAHEEARGRNFDEAVQLNERGEIAGATMANLFWVTKGTAHTPALSTGAIAGTTRAYVIELAAELSVPLVEGVYDLAHLSDAEEIFLTSASLSIALVTTYDFHRYTIPVGSVALRLRAALRDRMYRDPNADDNAREDPRY
jgi:branched-subunit amino acid aminotransferase/4-amino-4-deoxychorismate lyase